MSRKLEVLLPIAGILFAIWLASWTLQGCSFERPKTVVIKAKGIPPYVHKFNDGRVTCYVIESQANTAISCLQFRL